GHAAFCDHKRASSHNPFVESLVESCALFRQNPIPHSDACVSQLHDASTAVPRIRVGRADDYVFDSSFDNRICARPSAAGRRTRFQSDVKRRARGNGRTEIAKALDLGMGASCFAMMSFRHYLIVDYQDRADGRIWTRLAERLFCLAQRTGHELCVSVSRHVPGGIVGPNFGITRVWRDSNPQPSDPKLDSWPVLLDCIKPPKIALLRGKMLGKFAFCITI